MPPAGIPDSKRRLMMARPAEKRSWLRPAYRAYHRLGIYTCSSSPATWLGYLGLLFYSIKFSQVFISAARLGLAPLLHTLPQPTTNTYLPWLILGIYREPV